MVPEVTDIALNVVSLREVGSEALTIEDTTIVLFNTTNEMVDEGGAFVLNVLLLLRHILLYLVNQRGHHLLNLTDSGALLTSSTIDNGVIMVDETLLTNHRIRLATQTRQLERGLPIGRTVIKHTSSGSMLSPGTQP